MFTLWAMNNLTPTHKFKCPKLWKK